MCAKHYENPTMLSKVTAKNVGDAFLRHTVDFQYGGRLFSESGSSYISAVAGASFKGLWTPRIVKCKNFALPASSNGSLYCSHNGR